MAAWVLVLVVDMGVLRPPVEYRYPMPSQSECHAAVAASRVEAGKEKPMALFCIKA